MKQSACHKSQKKDDTNLQTLTTVAKMPDSGCDKLTEIRCKNNFTICGRRSHPSTILIPPPLYISIIERRPIFTFTLTRERRRY
jgi:hypothetical protein